MPVPVEAKKRKRSPSGRKLGKRCVPTSVPAGICEAGTASPPDAGTTKRVPVKVGANTIRSPAPQAPPRALGRARLGDGARRATEEIDHLEAALREEAEPPAVGRPEGKTRIDRPG